MTRGASIIFVNPPCRCVVAEVAGRWIPLGLVYLAGAARQAGLQAEIYDAMGRGDSHEEIERRLRSAPPDYLAVTAVTSTIHEALRVLETARSIRPETVTILGGVHPSFLPEEALASTAVDYVVCGEGEETLRELLTVLEQKRDPASVTGIAFRKEGRVVRTPRRPLVADLDELRPAWDLLEWEEYRYLVIPGSRLGSVSTSRGCEHRCTFCSQQRFWENSWRGRDPEKVAQEIEALHRGYGVNVFLLTDEHPTRSRERWERLLDLLIERALPVSFLMETRPGDIVRDRDIMGKYRRAGIVHISLGAESPEQATLARLGKEASVEETPLALEAIHAAGIVSEASFILGFPEETLESARKALQTAQRWNPDTANFLAFTPWPWSQTYRALQESLPVNDYSRYNLVDAVVEPEGLSVQQVDVVLAECYRKFYMGKMIDVMTQKDEFKRNYLMKATRLFMTSPFVMRKLGIEVVGKLTGRGKK